MNLEKTEQHIVNWLSDYLKKSGSQGFVVGVSGGIDSAVVSTLAARTGAPLLCLEMPIHQSPDQVSRALKHIDRLRKKHSNVSLAQVNLTNVFEAFNKEVPAIADSDLKNLSLANTRARLRMTTLYYFAGLHRYLVVGTGNKVEDFGVGFYTKYGDGGVDVSPIADLTKTEVFAMGKHLEVIDEILNAPPTDGLWGDERTDEDQIGATYPELEWAMEQHAYNKKIDDFVGRQREVYQIYLKLHRSNQHKMVPIPVCMVPEGFRKERAE
jgi:NAD+ synthase